MKKIYILMLTGLLGFTTSGFSATNGTSTPANTTATTTSTTTTTTPATTTTTQGTVDAQTQYKLQMASEGCKKPLGFFPTPAKLMCVLTALGIPENEAKAKQLALIFNVCHGRTISQQPATVKPKVYNTLGACLSDPAGINLINQELSSQGLGTIKVQNQGILNQQQPTSNSL